MRVGVLVSTMPSQQTTPAAYCRIRVHVSMRECIDVSVCLGTEGWRLLKLNVDGVQRPAPLDYHQSCQVGRVQCRCLQRQWVLGFSADFFSKRVSEHADGERRGPAADPKGSLKTRLIETFPMPPLGSALAIGIRRRHAPKEKKIRTRPSP